MLKSGNTKSKRGQTVKRTLTFSCVLLFCGVASASLITSTMQSAKAMSYHQQFVQTVRADTTPNPSVLMTPPPTQPPLLTPTQPVGNPGSADDPAATPTATDTSTATPTDTSTPATIESTVPPTQSPPNTTETFPGLPPTGSDPYGAALP